MKNRRKIVALLLLFVLTGYISAQNKSSKRGICGDATPEDMAVMSSAISWYYDWGVAPPAIVQDKLSGVEWVPMVWGGVTNQDIATIESKIPAGSKYLLGFNEPNFKSQANLTPAQAAAMWPVMEKISADKGLQLVSPAVNWCGDCVTGVSNDPIDWLDQFIAACPSCKFDYIAIHNYSPSSGALQSYIEKFRKYNKPLWITEFAPWDPPKPDFAGVVQYMKEAIPILENEPIVFRYSWFATRVSSNPDIDILAENGKLTKLGQLYTNMSFPGLNTDLAPVALAGTEISINLPSTSAVLKGSTYDANGDAITVSWTQVSGPNTAIIENASAEQPTVSELIPGSYTFKMSIAANGKTDADEVNVTVGNTDIGRNKPITASSAENTGTPATNANDGNATTRWSSAFSDPQWIQIDLQSTYLITGVNLVWEAAASKSYQIQVSDDAVTWKTVYTNTSGNGGTDKISFSEAGRYVRMYSTQRTTAWGNSLYEFEVYGTPIQTGTNKLEAKNFSVIPNPVKNGSFKINFNESIIDEDAIITINNTLGQPICVLPVKMNSKEITVSTRDMRPGLYFITLTSKNIISQAKLVVE